MNDDAYIPANERERSIRILLDGGYTGAATKILQSHAVLDSVAQELADALRRFMPDDKTSADNHNEYLAHLALWRFDNLNKKADTE